MLTSSMLTTLRLLAPLMELRGIDRLQWAHDADTSTLTLKRYLNPRTCVGDEATVDRLVSAADCFVVVNAEGALGEAWRESILAALAERHERLARSGRAPG